MVFIFIKQSEEYISILLIELTKSNGYSEIMHHEGMSHTNTKQVGREMFQAKIRASLKALGQEDAGHPPETGSQ